MSTKVPNTYLNGPVHQTLRIFYELCYCVIPSQGMGKQKKRRSPRSDSLPTGLPSVKQAEASMAATSIGSPVQQTVMHLNESVLYGVYILICSNFVVYNMMFRNCRYLYVHVCFCDCMLFNYSFAVPTKKPKFVRVRPSRTLPQMLGRS